MEIILDFCSNWNTLDNYLKMLSTAKKCGFKHVKLQLFRPDQVPEAYRRFSLTKQKAKAMFDLATDMGFTCFFTPCYPEAVKWCEEFGVSMYKIRFVDRNFQKLITLIKATGKPIICSTNERTVPKNNNWDDMFCIPQYPANARLYDRHYTEWDGISDHTRGTALLRYVSRNEPHLKWFEKHVYLDENCLEKKWSVPIEEMMLR